jgi:uncharacterized membrane protein YdcZ (DUF606 family)
VSRYLVLAGLAGVLSAVQAALLGGATGKVSGLTVATASAFLAGLLGVALLATQGRVGSLHSALSWRLALASVCSIGIVTFIAVTAHALGPGTSLTVIVASQLLAVVIIDATGVAGPRVSLSVARVAGALLIAVGGALIARGA